MSVMLLLNVVTQVPQLNLAKLFSVHAGREDPERQTLTEAASANTAPSYSRQMDEPEAQTTNDGQVKHWSNKY